MKAGPQENQDTSKGISHRFEKMRELVTQRLHQVHLRQKAYYDANRRETQYGEGDLVLIYKPFRKVGKSEKLLHRWLGKVKKFRGSSDKTEIEHVVNIKKFNVRSPEALLKIHQMNHRNKIRERTLRNVNPEDRGN